MATLDPYYDSGEDPDYQIEEEDEEEDDSGDDDYDLDDDASQLDPDYPGSPVPEVDGVVPVGAGEGGGGGAEEVVEVSGLGGEEGEGSGGGGGADGEMVDRVDLVQSSYPICPICYESWSAEGPHRVCCIHCGHLYGRSCLEKWAGRCGNNSAKCPQCNKKFRKKDIINLFAPVIGVQNHDLQKELHSLREKNELLMLEKARLMQEIENNKKKPCLMNRVQGSAQRRLYDCYANWWSPSVQTLSGESISPQNHGRGDFQHCSFVLKNELMLDGARVLGIDAPCQIVIVSLKATGLGGAHLLNKISLLDPHVIDEIRLPPNTGTIRDLCILPGRLALLASLGKKLSLFSTESNNVVLKYDLPVPVWSCSSDATSPYYIYAGLQNGMLFMFDLRQTESHVSSIEGLSGHPIHTIHSIAHNDNSRKVLTASSLGPCICDLGGNDERPMLIPEMDNQGVCISLACSTSTDDIVASYRPKVEVYNDIYGSQISASPSPPVSGSGRLGTHVLIKRVNGTCYQRDRTGYGYVSELRMSKSAIISTGGSYPLFAYGDEMTRGVCLAELPSFQVAGRLLPHQSSLLDLKYARAAGPGILGCISEDRMQLFTCSDL